jgi:hypothetical protein
MLTRVMPQTRDGAVVPRSARQSPVEQVFQFCTGFIISSALNVTVRLGIPDRLSAGPQTARELAAATGTQEEPLYRLLRTLAGVGLFAEDDDHRFVLTETSTLLRSDAPHSLKAMAVWNGSPFHFRVYADLMHSVRTGQPAVERVYGASMFEHLARDHDVAREFDAAMAAFSASIVPFILDAYDFSGRKVLVDLGGGHGAVLTSILLRYPTMHGILTDLEHVIAGAVPCIAQLGLADRCQAIAADFFRAVPAGGDTYLMQHVIHDWDDVRARIILRHVHAALDGVECGRLLLCESIVAPANQPDVTKLIDLEMLVMPGGRERDEAEFRALLADTGFELLRILRTRSPTLRILEAALR